mmetsp:Transcript_1410/g.2500  ORF Transcript_1410/g.2500 Transcript_1410/m.2500 type:complete len:221 (+) Transcript_1410:790-1452(+)
MATSALSTRCRSPISRRVRAMEAASVPFDASSMLGCSLVMPSSARCDGAEGRGPASLAVRSAAASASILLYSDPAGGRPLNEAPSFSCMDTSSTTCSMGSRSEERSSPNVDSVPAVAVGTRMPLGFLLTVRSGPRKRSCTALSFSGRVEIPSALSRACTNSSSGGVGGLRDIPGWDALPTLVEVGGSGTRCSRVRGGVGRVGLDQACLSSATSGARTSRT